MTDLILTEKPSVAFDFAKALGVKLSLRSWLSGFWRCSA